MEYELVAIAGGEEGHLIGFVIKRANLPKLEGTNIYAPDEYEEAKEQVRYLNEATALRQFWPMPNEPEVEELLNDPGFEPVEYDMVEVPDLDNSELTYDMKPGPQIATDPTGNPVFGEDEVKYDDVGKPSINYSASTIFYKKVKAPRQTDVRGRIDRACEIVARNRMEATINA